MKVGDIGVLQHFEIYKYYNGTVAEIILSFKKGQLTTEYGPGSRHFAFNGVEIRAFDGQEIPISRYKIRPLTDPDAEQETEQELVLINAK